MSPWPPEGSRREGHEAGDAAAARACGSRGRAQVRPRRRAQRARARLGPAYRGPRRGRRGREGAACARSGSRSAASRVDEEGLRAGRRRGAVPSATRSAGSSRSRATGVPPGLGSYATKEDRLDARLAAALMGIQAVKGVEIGDGFAARRSARLRRRTTRSAPTGAATRTMPAGSKAGVSNGEEIVVRAAMKPLPTLMKPLALGRPRDRRGGRSARRALRRGGRRGARGRRGGGRRVGARRRSAREVRRRRGRRLRRGARRAYLARIEW